MVGSLAVAGAASGQLEAEYRDKEQHLLRDLQALTELLRSVGEGGWATHFAARWRELTAAAARGECRAEKARICQALRGAFRGAHPFTDLVIHPLNGHRVRPDELRRLNSRLDAPRASVYGLSWLYQEHRYRGLERP